MTASALDADPMNATFQNVSFNVILDERQALWFAALLSIMDNLSN